jgi:kynurenine formamidase
MMLVVLSHPLGPDAPNWPGAPNLEMRPFHSMSGGDIANTHVLEVYNHQGTHVDAPSHVNPEGATLSDLSPEYFVFERPLVVDLPLTDRQLIRPEDLDAYAGGPDQPDLIIFRSGFEAVREDRTRYEKEGPGFSAAAVRRLWEDFPGLRAVAMDWLSLAAYSAAEEGMEAHRELLGRGRGDRFVLIFEDVRVSGLEGRRPVRVVCTPLFADGLDGSPCTVLTEVSQEV